MVISEEWGNWLKGYKLEVTPDWEYNVNKRELRNIWNSASEAFDILITRTIEPFC